MSSRILIIIPSYNEEATVGAVIDEVRRFVPEATILVVDDGSKDATSSKALAKGVKAVRHPFNMGVGAAMQTGYKYALRNGFDIAVQMDADGQHPAKQIRDLVAPLIRDEIDMVVGSRFLGAGEYKPSMARAAGIAIFSKVVSFIIKEKLTDTTSGFRAVNREVIEFLSRAYPDDYPEVEALVLLHKKGFAIMEVPVIMSERKGGKSSITASKSAYYMVKVLLAVFVDLLKKVK
ncbi:MAG TPA: glycosyltransferase family 2 protein [Thermodesulfobacteriota bacterium]|nr:glycosyltransferase family 2 protein [Thermodesulfobacteriota bacterium]